MTWLRVLGSRLLELLCRTGRDRRLDAEVDLHLALLTDEGVARGLSPDQARIEARRRFGGVDQLKLRYRDQRGLPGFDSLWQDTRFAWRALACDRGFTTTAALVLALGIGVNNMMFTILNAHTIRGLPLANAERVMYVSTRDKAGADRGLSWPEFEDLRRAARSAEFGAWVSGTASLANPHEAPDRVDRSHIAVGTFAALGIEPFLGRGLTAADAEPGAAPVALISERLWSTKYNSDSAAVGRDVLVDGVPTTVVGIVERESGFPAVADLWQPLERMAGLQAATRSARTLRVIGRARPGIGVASARAEVEAAFAANVTAPSGAGTDIRAVAVPVNERVLGRLLDPAWLAFMTVGCLVALISCANVANLLLGRALHRDREIVLRTALGASRGRIVRQLLIESALLAGIGGALGLAVAVAGVRLFRRGIPANVLPYWMDYVIDSRVLLALLLASTVATLVFGLVPALQGSRSDPQPVLRQGGPTIVRTRSSNRWTTAFLVAELALSVVMLTNLALAWRVARTGLPTDAALYADDVLTATFTLPVERYGDASSRLAFLRQVEERLAGTSGVVATAAATVLPVRSAPERQLRARDTGTRDALPARQVLVTPAYFDALGLSLKSGRALSGDGAGPAASSIVLNEHLAGALFTNRDPLGQRVGFVASAGEEPTEWLTVVGVAPAIRQRPSSDPEAVVYRLLAADPPATMTLIVRGTLAPAAASDLLRQSVLGIDPHLPLYNLATLRQATTEAEWNGRVSGRLLFALTTIALSLAAVGLYAVTMRAVAGRRREIGIRLAVGATPSQIRRMVARHAGRRVVIGMSAGVACVVAWERAFPPSVRPRATAPELTLADPYVLLAVAGVLVLVTVLACVVPIRRAQAVKPSLALGQD
jgi:predicted permease